MKAQTCPKCNGMGWNEPESGGGTDLTTMECGVCRGKGIVFIPETLGEFTMVMNYIQTVAVYSKTAETIDCDRKTYEQGETSSSTVINSEHDNITLT